MTFKEFIKLLNARDDVIKGGSIDQALRNVTNEQFKVMFWAIASMFKTMKREAERRGLWDELTGKK